MRRFEDAADATSHAYGGGWTALGLVATSTPPSRAGVQLPLIDLLLDRGAAIDGVRPGAGYVRDALANGCPEAARALADRGARLDLVTAAGVGRLDRVQELAEGAGEGELEKALVTAAGTYGAHDVVEYLPDRGADVAAGSRWTALHAATGSGDLRTIELLIRLGFLPRIELAFCLERETEKLIKALSSPGLRIDDKLSTCFRTHYCAIFAGSTPVLRTINGLIIRK